MKITENFLWDEDLNYRSKWLYFVLTYLSREGGAGDGCFFACSQEELISNAGMAGPTIMKCREALVKNGWLKHEIRLFKGHRVSHYRILVIDRLSFVTLA